MYYNIYIVINDPPTLSETKKNMYFTEDNV